MNASMKYKSANVAPVRYSGSGSPKIVLESNTFTFEDDVKW